MGLTFGFDGRQGWLVSKSEQVTTSAIRVTKD